MPLFSESDKIIVTHCLVDKGSQPGNIVTRASRRFTLVTPKFEKWQLCSCGLLTGPPYSSLFVPQQPNNLVTVTKEESLRQNPRKNQKT